MDEKYTKTIKKLQTQIHNNEKDLETTLKELNEKE
jgi:hypothetical protein